MDQEEDGPTVKEKPQLQDERLLTRKGIEKSIESSSPVVEEFASNPKDKGKSMSPTKSKDRSRCPQLGVAKREGLSSSLLHHR